MQVQVCEDPILYSLACQYVGSVMYSLFIDALMYTTYTRIGGKLAVNEVIFFVSGNFYSRDSILKFCES